MKILIIFLVICSPLIAIAQNQIEDAGPFSKVLNRDGSLGPNSGSGMSFDARGYRMKLGKKGEPHFFPAAAQATDEWDSLFNVPGYSDGLDNVEIDAIASDGDMVYIGGSFEYFEAVHAYNIVQYNKKTKEWSAMGDGFGATVRALQVAGGKLYAGGIFSEAGATNAKMRGIAVWDGASWSELGGGVNGDVFAIAAIGNNIIIGGNFSEAGTSSVVQAPNIARWNGQQWDDMGGVINGDVYSLLVTGDSLFVGGQFWNSSVGVRRIAMFRSENWEGLAMALDGDVFTMAMYKGKLWAGGDFFYTYDLTYEKPTYCLAAWDGSEWQTFGSPGHEGVERGTVRSLLVVGDSLYIGGNFASVAGVSAHSIAKFRNGTFSALGNGVFGTVRSLGVFNGQIYVGGTFGIPHFLSINHIASLKPGDVWGAPESKTTVARGGYSATAVEAVAVTDRYVFIGGEFTSLGLSAVNHIAMWDKQTRTWSALGNGVDEDVYSIAVQGSKVYVGGGFNYADTVVARHIAYWDMTTHNWHAMGAGSERYIRAIAANESGVYACNYFIVEDDHFNNYIGRWDGVKWNRIDDPIIGFINAMAIKDTVLCIAGFISSIDGDGYANIAIHYPSGWVHLGDGLDDGVRAITFGVDINDLYATGYFGHSAGLDLFGIGRWDGVQWYNIGGGLSDFGYAITWDGKNIYCGGRFTRAGTHPANFLAKWDFQDWSPVNGGTDYPVYSLATDTKNLYCGGGFTFVGNNYLSYRFAILHFGNSSVSENAEADNFSVSVNPTVISTTSTITVTSTDPTDASIEIVNVLGAPVQQVQTKHVQSGETQFTFDSRGLASGTYFVRIKAAGQQKMGKIIVE